MKSKIVKVKVWYEHHPDLSSADVSDRLDVAIEGALGACVWPISDPSDKVEIHNIEVGNDLVRKPQRPEPDFE